MHIQEVIGLVRDDMRRVEEGFVRNLSSDVRLIGKVGEYILKSGGKRFRPLLMLLCSRLSGYKGDAHIHLAGVVEFIHTATLLHDDVVDNANLRRGNASANTLWGDGASILVGDYLLSKAFSLAVQYGDAKVLKILSDTTTRMAEGEVMQLIRHGDVETVERQYLDVITNKTAVLFSASTRIAAVLGGVAPDKESALSDYGLLLGTAYQLMDDCLDYTSTDEDLGKTIGSDLREGKVTLPLIQAYRKATPAEKDFLKDAVEGRMEAGFTEERLREVIAIIEGYGGITYTVEKASSAIEEAKGKLDLFEPDIERMALMAIADFAINRTY